MLDKTFNPKEVEQHLYELWERDGAYCPHKVTGASTFSITMPPPNVTGTLHMGHALNMTLQDILARYKRMEGYNVLWQPGMDHAGIATQLIVERELEKENLSSKKIGREAFIQRVWEWKRQYGGKIGAQLRALGAAPAWPRERFTLDDSSNEAVKEAFIQLYHDGLIYRDTRLVNWDPKFCSAISDLEVENKETKGTLWYIAYPLEEGNGSITIATTRPETLLADTAVAVHPEDTRYKAYIGKNVIVPLIGRAIPVIADIHSDPEKGTGAVKITPAHDFNDFEVGKRHDLCMLNVLDPHGHIDITALHSDLAHPTDQCDVDFIKTLAGRSAADARKAVCQALEDKQFLVNAEPHLHSVPHAQRGDAVIEPRLTTQWFCDAPRLAPAAVEAVTSKQTQFIPQQWENTFFAWMRDLQPWCISRQLWWGHRIPAWYGPDNHIFVAKDEEDAAQQAQAYYGYDVTLKQEEDVLDTWFSSGLWPFSTLGWPHKTPELKAFYPTNVLVTGFDIIFFWVARMLMMSMYFMKEIPFRDIFVHGLVRDERGQKMSKSKGNGIDPLYLIEQYGADPLRFTVCALTGIGRDLRFGEKRVRDSRAFITKLWNGARFLQIQKMSARAFDPLTLPQTSHPLHGWILAETAQAACKARVALQKYRFDEYASAIYHFTWHIFCDWYLELVKPQLQGADTQLADATKKVTLYVFGVILRLLQPITPFVTDTLWSHMGYGEEGSLITQKWPQLTPQTQWEKGVAQTQRVIQLISEIRTIKSEMNVPPAQKTPLYLKNLSRDVFDEIKNAQQAISHMARISHIAFAEDTLPEGCVQIVLNDGILAFLPLASYIDSGAEKKRLQKEYDKTLTQKEKTEKRLNNPKFMNNAKAEIIEEMRQRLHEQQKLCGRLSHALDYLSSLRA